MEGRAGRNKDNENAVQTSPAYLFEVSYLLASVCQCF